MSMPRAAALAMLFLLSCGQPPRSLLQEQGLPGAWGEVLHWGRLSQSSDAATPSARWSPTGAMTTSRQLHTATLLPSGKVLVVGGLTTAGTSLATAEVFDPWTGTWSATGSLTTARGGHTATLLPSGRVLVTGGQNENGGLTTSEAYDPKTGTWSLAGPLISARAGHTATLLLSGEILVAGGTDYRLIPLSTAELYDPVAGTWRTTSSLSTARYGHTATRLPSGKVLVAGGNGFGGPESRAEIYNPETGGWTETRPLSTGRGAHTATLLPSGLVLVAGGAISVSSVFSGWSGAGGPSPEAIGVIPSSELYDPDTGQWSSTGSLGMARCYHSATLLTSGKVLVAGGKGTYAMEVSAELFDPATGSWSDTELMSSGAQFHVATLLQAGSVLVTGGRTAGSTITAEIYEPATGAWHVTPPLLVATFNSTAMLLPSGKVLLAGGRNLSGSESRAEIYDPGLGTWRATGSLAIRRSSHTATLLPSGKVLVTGGDPGSVDVDASAELYDPVTETWSLTGSMITPRSGHSAILLLSGKVLVVGGPSSAAEVYDPATGAWRRTGSLIKGSRHHTLTLLKSGKVLVAGGTDGDRTLTRAEVYEPETERWSPTGSLLGERVKHTATLLPSGKVLVAGGIVGIVPIASAELYDPATGAWSPTGPLNAIRYDARAILLPSGRVLVSGGRNGTAVVDSAEVYDPATETWSVVSSLSTGRADFTMVLLPTGNVMVAGGRNGTGFISETELYGATAAQDSWHPTVNSPGTRWHAAMSVTLRGAGLLGLSEASGGNVQSSATNFPMATLMAFEGGGMLNLPGTDFSSTSLRLETPLTLSPGYHLLFATTNAIPGGTIVRVNYPPVPQPQSLRTREDTPLEIQLTCKDPDDDPCTVRIQTAPAHGRLSVSGPDALYTPALHYSGADSFSFVASDGREESAPGIVSLTVDPLNQAPVAQPLSVSTFEDTPVLITLLASDAEQAPLRYSEDNPRLGMLSCDEPPTCIYTPPPGFVGTDSFKYKANDGLLDSSEATVTIAVVHDNHPPTASDVSVKTIREMAVSVTLAARDIDDDKLSYLLLTTPTHGVLSGAPPDLALAPEPGYVGLDSFTYQASDGVDRSNVATVSIEVRPRPPRGCGGCASTNGEMSSAEGALLLLGVLACRLRVRSPPRISA